jgi:PAS domain S-box-containing protein
MKKSQSQNFQKISRFLKKSVKKMETVFPEDQDLLKKLLSVIPDAVILTDLLGKVIFVNDVAIKLAEYSTAKKIVGQDAISFISPQYREKAEVNLARLVKGLPRSLNVYANDYELIAADGSYIPVEIHGNILKNSDGSPFAMVHVLRDITARKKTEDALIKSEHKFHTILDKLPDAVIIADAKGRIIDFNLMARTLFGYSKKELLGLHFTKLHPREDVEKMQNAFNRFVNQKGGHVGDVRVLTKDGRLINVDINGIRIEMDNQSWIVGLFRDMTSYKEREKNLKTAQKNLEAQIAERTIELMQRNTALNLLLSEVDQEKVERESRIITEIQSRIRPHIQALNKANLSSSHKGHVIHIEKGFQTALSKVISDIRPSTTNLTPQEIKVSSLVRQGMSTREIAKIMGISTKTVDIFRYNIRKKLGLNKRRRTNLASHLMSMESVYKKNFS